MVPYRCASEWAWNFCGFTSTRKHSCRRIGVFTRLHAGGKFNKKDGNSAYAFSGDHMAWAFQLPMPYPPRLKLPPLEVKFTARLAGGDVIEPLTQIGQQASKTAHRSARGPDGKYFEQADYSITELERLLRASRLTIRHHRFTRLC